MSNSANTNPTQIWSETIKPQKHWLDINFKELWEYRDLVYMYIKRDFVTFYKQKSLYEEWEKTGDVKSTTTNIEKYSKEYQTKKLVELINSIT
jgi:hypothetical protein